MYAEFSRDGGLVPGLPLSPKRARSARGRQGPHEEKPQCQQEAGATCSLVSPQRRSAEATGGGHFHPQVPAIGPPSRLLQALRKQPGVCRSVLKGQVHCDSRVRPHSQALRTGCGSQQNSHS